MHRSLGLIFLVMFFSPTVLIADPEIRSENLKKINAQVAAEDRRLEEIAVSVKTLTADIATYEKEVQELRLRAKNLSGELDRVVAKRGEVDKQLAEINAEQQDLRHLSEARVRLMYMTHKRENTESLFTLTQSAHFMRHAYYLGKVRAFDQELLDRLQHLKEKHDVKRHELQSLILDHDLLKQKLLDEQRRLEEKVNEQRTAINSLKDQKREREKALTGLRAQALRLETVVVSLTGGGDAALLVPKEEPKSSVTLSVKGGQTGVRFSGTGLADKRGKLLKPISGKIKRGFGRHKVSGFSDIVLSKGVEFVAREHSPVSAVEAGRVMYTGAMPGFGTIAILDHGKRQYSLYGRLDRVKIAAGSVVEKGAVVGSTSALDERGSNFYFEIRKGGKPVDPATFYPNGLESR